MEEFNIKLTSTGSSTNLYWDAEIQGRMTLDEGNTVVGHTKEAHRVPLIDLMDIVDYLITEIRYDWSKYGKA